MSRPKSQPSPIVVAKARLQTACMHLAAILDASLHGGRDPTWAESQEFEAAGIEYGRMLNRVATRRVP